MDVCAIESGSVGAKLGGRMRHLIWLCWGQTRWTCAPSNLAL